MQSLLLFFHFSIALNKSQVLALHYVVSRPTCPGVYLYFRLSSFAARTVTASTCLPNVHSVQHMYLLGQWVAVDRRMSAYEDIKRPLRESRGSPSVQESNHGCPE